MTTKLVPIKSYKHRIKLRISLNYSPFMFGASYFFLQGTKCAILQEEPTTTKTRVLTLLNPIQNPISHPTMVHVELAKVDTNQHFARYHSPYLMSATKWAISHCIHRQQWEDTEDNTWREHFVSAVPRTIVSFFFFLNGSSDYCINVIILVY